MVALLPVILTQANRIPMEYSEQGFSLREMVFLFLLVFVSVLLVVRIIKLFGSKDYSSKSPAGVFSRSASRNSRADPRNSAIKNPFRIKISGTELTLL